MSNGRRSAAILIATVTPAEVETRKGANGAYTVMPGATVSREGKEDMVRTVMAFGKPNEAISTLLKSGVPVMLALRFDGGSMKVVGMPRTRSTLVSDPRDVVVEILKKAGLDEDMATTTYQEMLSGCDDRPSDPEIDLDPDMLEEIGHLLLPILSTGIDLMQALDITEELRTSSASDHLEDAGTLVRQNVARDFVTDI